MSTDLFFFNDTATTAIYTLSLHDALPISVDTVVADLGVTQVQVGAMVETVAAVAAVDELCAVADRSEEHTSELSHVEISYAVFCLKKKNNQLTEGMPEANPG